MCEPSDDLDLAKEALRAERADEIGVEHFDRHGPLVPTIDGEVDARHAPTADLALDEITIVERALDVRGEVNLRGHVGATGATTESVAEEAGAPDESRREQLAARICSRTI
jgi:hypothetical protein